MVESISLCWKQSAGMHIMGRPNLIELLAEYGVADNNIPASLNAVMSYYFRQCSWADSRQKLLSISPALNVAALKKRIIMDYDFMCLKMALVDIRVNKTGLRPAAQRNGIISTNLSVLEMTSSLPFFGNIPEDTEYKTPKEVRALVREVLKICHPNTRSFIWRKLRFLTMSNAHSSEDFLSEFRARQIALVYMHYPILSGLYLTNTIKADIKNYGTNLIAYWTSSKRQDLHDEDGLCRFREESLAFHDNENTEQLTDNTQSSYDRLLNFDSLNVLLARETGYVQDILRFLTFTHPRQEKTFLAKYGKDGDTSCEDVFDRCGADVFASYIKEHLRVPTYVFDMARRMIQKEMLESV